MPGLVLQVELTFVWPPNLDLHALFERISMLRLEYNQRKKREVQATDSSGHIGINYKLQIGWL